jgi:cysteinyl-tRNA synthetase
MALSLHNTLTGQGRAVRAREPPEVRMYVCGPTVYGRAHIGNFRSFLATDLLRRTLRYKGWRVKEVMNLTDVDDRIIQLAAEAGSDLETFTAGHIRSFREDMATLGMEEPEVVPRATEHIPEMVELVSRLTGSGHTYTVDGSVYFRIASFPEYGRLSHLDVEGHQGGRARGHGQIRQGERADFVLWKAKSDEPAWAQWDAPFGAGGRAGTSSARP